MLGLLTLPAIQNWIFICGFVWSGLHREIGSPRLGNSVFSFSPFPPDRRGVQPPVPRDAHHSDVILYSHLTPELARVLQKNRTYEREREKLFYKLARVMKEAGKSKICSANVLVWVGRPEAAVEQEEVLGQCEDYQAGEFSVTYGRVSLWFYLGLQLLR